MKTSTKLIFTLLFTMCALSVFALDAYEATLQQKTSGEWEQA